MMVQESLERGWCNGQMSTTAPCGHTSLIFLRKLDRAERVQPEVMFCQPRFPSARSHMGLQKALLALVFRSYSFLIYFQGCWEQGVPTSYHFNDPGGFPEVMYYCFRQQSHIQ